MPKRRHDEKIQYYERKIQKIRNKQSVAPRRRVVYSDSSSDEISGTGSLPSRGESPENIADILIHEPNQAAEPPPTTEAETLLATDGAVVPPQPVEPPVEDVTPAPELDPDIIEALGSKTSEEPEYGDKIHENLSQLWLPLLKKGMSKEDKESTLKQYLVPQNCTLLQAPKLNLEISAALTESARNKDKKLVSHQQQLGQGITAVNRAMDLLLSKEEDGKLAAIKHLSNACRILCDLHHVDSQVRIKLITPSLDKSFINVVQDFQRDETLFGTKLSEKIKSSKAIEKQGLQIKKLTSTGPAPSTGTPRPGPNRGNWQAPPRHSSNSRGTRGGYRRAPPARRQPRAPAPLPPPQTRQAASRQQQARAPQQQ